MRLEPDPKECNLDSTRPEQDKWRGKDGWIILKKVDKEKLNYTLEEEDLPFIKPSDKLRLFLEADLAKKLRQPGYFYLHASAWRGIQREVGGLIEPTGGVSGAAYSVYASENPELEEMCRAHKNADATLARIAAEKAREATRLRILYSGYRGMSPTVLLQRIGIVLPSLNPQGFKITTVFYLKEGETGYIANKKIENGRGFIHADPDVAEVLLAAAAEKKIQISGPGGRPWTITMKLSPKKE